MRVSLKPVASITIISESMDVFSFAISGKLRVFYPLRSYLHFIKIHSRVVSNSAVMQFLKKGGKYRVSEKDVCFKCVHISERLREKRHLKVRTKKKSS